jgi:hypothetical protein
MYHPTFKNKKNLELTQNWLQRKNIRMGLKDKRCKEGCRIELDQGHI